MAGFFTNIEEKTLTNSCFRQVLFTGKYAQLVVMSLRPKEEISMEIHQTVDQFFRIEAGEGKVIMAGVERQFTDGDVFIVPAGTEHNVINTSADKDLKLYTIYSPPNHPPETVHITKGEAMAAEKVRH